VVRGDEVTSAWRSACTWRHAAAAAAARTSLKPARRDYAVAVLQLLFDVGVLCRTCSAGCNATQDKWAATPNRRNVCLRRESAFDLAVTSDPETFSAMSTHMINIVASIIEITPLSTEKSRHGINGRTDGRPTYIMSLAAYCLRRRHNN